MPSLTTYRRAAERRAAERYADSFEHADLALVYADARQRVTEDAAAIHGDPANAMSERAKEMLQSALVRSVARERSLVLGLAIAAARRLSVTSGWKLIPYPSQIEAAIAATDDAIVELATGEGKTLVAALAAAVWALPGAGVHLVTANGYLASRDALWMTPLYAALGLTVASLDSTSPGSRERQAAYAADVTYASVSEIGFDYLRDHTVGSAGARVQRAAWGCLVDEADAVLIDDAGTPLILSGPSLLGDDSTALMMEADAIARDLCQRQHERVSTMVRMAVDEWRNGNIDVAAETMAAALQGGPRHPQVIESLARIPGLSAAVGSLTQLKSTVERVQAREADLLLVVDTNARTAALTDLGRSMLSSLWGDVDTPEGERRSQILGQALRAHSLFERDRDYLLDENGDASIIDPRTGRVLSGRRWSDGLHQAIEIKEGVVAQAEMRTLARCTIQSYFRRYARLAGMTGTAKDASREFENVYRCRVVHIHPNVPSRRIDAPDMLFPSQGDRTRFLIAQTRRLRALGLPVVIAAPTVLVAEETAARMAEAGLPVSLLTARVPADEAAIVARAGRSGAVTVTTAMAGRGTDIVVEAEALADRDEAWCDARGLDRSLLPAGGREAAGLHVIAMGRWGSRRVDRQLKGRAGRQGEPGWTQTLVAADDPIVLDSGVDRALSLLEKIGALTPEGASSVAVTRLLERAQRAIASRAEEGRQRMTGMESWLNAQQEMVYGLRELILEDPLEAADWVRTAAQEGVLILQRRLEGDAAATEGEPEWDGEVIDAPSAQTEQAALAQDLLALLGADPAATLAEYEALMRRGYGDAVIQQMACAGIDGWWGEHLAWYDAARASGIHQGDEALRALATRSDEAFEAGRQDLCVQMVMWLREKSADLSRAPGDTPGETLVPVTGS